MDARRAIEAARAGFDSRLHGGEYRRVHSDDDQLARLIELLGPRAGGDYLDLGTGNGYVAFALAESYPGLRARGLDIASRSIERDNEIARERGLANLDFIAYDGLDLPFADACFAGAVSRYAFHHFPDARRTVAELCRVIEDGGSFALSDPRTLDEDEGGFIDAFQSLRPDGHVHFYRRSEVETLFAEAGFAVEDEFESVVRYPREMDERYGNLIGGCPRGLLDLYKVEVEAGKVYVEAAVMNIRFRKTARARA